MAMSSGYEKKGVPAGTPLVAGHAGICNSIAKHYTQRKGICQPSSTRYMVQCYYIVLFLSCFFTTIGSVFCSFGNVLS